MITDVKTQIISAREGIITDEMKYVAETEGVSPEFVREGVEKGSIVILKNNQRKDSIPVGVGAGLSVKINANIGTSNEGKNYFFNKTSDWDRSYVSSRKRSTG